MGEFAPIALLVVGMLLLLGFSHLLFRSNRTRVMRPSPIVFTSRRSKSAAAEPQLVWRTLVAAPPADSRRARR